MALVVGSMPSVCRCEPAATSLKLLALPSPTPPLPPPHLPPPPVSCTAVGFPLVGGPAGTMEGGRQSEIAKAILSTKNVPYVVAAPLLIQVGGGG